MMNTNIVSALTLMFPYCIRTIAVRIIRSNGARATTAGNTVLMLVHTVNMDRSQLAKVNVCASAPTAALELWWASFKRGDFEVLFDAVEFTIRPYFSA